MEGSKEILIKLTRNKLIRIMIPFILVVFFTCASQSLAQGVTRISSQSGGAITTDGVNLYVGNGNSILSVPIGGGSATVIYANASPCCVVGLTRIGTDLFWIDPNGDPDATAIRRGPTSGGAVTKIYSGFATGQPIVDGVGITTDGTKLYTTDAVQGRVHSLNPDGSGITFLGSRYGGFFFGEHFNTLAVSGGTIFIVDPGNAQVGPAQPVLVRIPVTGGTFTTMVAGSPLVTPIGVAVGNGKIFIADAGAGNTIWQVPIGGGTPTALVSGAPFVQLSANGLVFFNNALYVSDSAGIFKVDLGGCRVDVQRLGQCDGKDTGASGFPAPHWGGEPYAFHTDAAGTICGWGCALTALSMSLTRAGVTQIPNFSSQNPSPNPIIQDPGFLNSLMTRQTFLADYDIIGNAFETSTDNNVNFDVTTRDVSNLLNLSQPLHFDSTFSPDSSPMSLEMALCHPGTGDKDKPTPVIVKVRSQCSDRPLRHFVLVTGKVVDPTDGIEKFKIADPAGRGFDENGNPVAGICETGRPVVTGKFLEGPPYNSQFQIVGSVTDPSGNVSGLDFVVGNSADLLVTDSNGRRTGFDPATGSILKEIPGASYLDVAIDDDETGAPGLSNRSVNIFRPEQGMYQVVITGLTLGAYALEVMPFAEDGSAEPHFFVPGIAAQFPSTFAIQYSSTPGSSSIVVRVATFQSTLADINNSFQLGLIDNQGIANSLLQKIEASADAAGRGQSQAARNLLGAFKDEVSAQTGKHVMGIAVQVLMEDVDSLISQLP